MAAGDAGVQSALQSTISPCGVSNARRGKGDSWRLKYIYIYRAIFFNSPRRSLVLPVSKTTLKKIGQHACVMLVQSYPFILITHVIVHRFPVPFWGFKVAPEKYLIGRKSPVYGTMWYNLWKNRLVLNYIDLKRSSSRWVMIASSSNRLRVHF